MPGIYLDELVFERHGLYNTTTDDLYSALNAPVTEISWWTLNSGTDSTQFISELNTDVQDIKVDIQPGVVTADAGTVIEDDTIFVQLVGWQSVTVGCDSLPEKIRG